MEPTTRVCGQQGDKEKTAVNQGNITEYILSRSKVMSGNRDHISSNYIYLIDIYLVDIYLIDVFNNMVDSN